MFEAKVGNADVLFCGFDFTIDRPAVKALENSINNYVNSDSFAPVQKLSAEELKKHSSKQKAGGISFRQLFI